MICFGCSAKISCSEINRKRKFGHYNGRLHWIYRLRCNKCKKTFDYLNFQQHKELFKNTLIAINGDAEEASMLQALLRDVEETSRLHALRDVEETSRLHALRDAEDAERLHALQACRSFSSNVGQYYSFGENLNGISGFSQFGGAHHNFYGRVSRL